MQIKSLKLKNFKKFADKEVEFKPGINVIYGVNEAGKSTILNSLGTVIYADVTTRSRSFFEESMPWKSQNNPVFKMVLSSGDSEYSVEKDFSSRKSNFTNLKEKLKLDENELVQKALMNIIRIPTLEIFNSTALVKQSQIAGIETSTDLIETVQNSIIGTSEEKSFKTLLRQINKEISELEIGLKRPSTNPGLIKTLQLELERLNERYTHSKQQLEKVIEAQSKGTTSTDELGKVNEQVEILETIINNQKIFSSAIAKIQNIDRQLKVLQGKLIKIEELDRKIDESKIKLDGFGVFTKGDADKDSAIIANIEGQIKARQSFLAKQPEKVVATSGNKRFFTKYSPLFGLLAALSVPLFVMTEFTYPAIALLIVGLGGLILGFTTKEKQSTAPQEPNDNKIEEEVRMDQQRLKQLFDRYSVASKEEFFAKKVKYITILANLKEFETERQATIEDKTRKDIEDEQINLLTQKKEIETNELTEEVRGSQLEPDEYLRKRRELDSLVVRKRMLEREQVQSQTRVEDADISHETIISMEEQIENVQAKLTVAKRNLEVLELVKEGFENAISSLSSGLQGVIIKNMEEDLSKITNGKYKDIQIDENFELKVFSSEKNDWIEPTRVLSSGTVDQIYFLYRLALLKAIEGKEPLPLLLDDPFVTFDKERLAGVKAILERESKDRQILLFTHNDIYRDWGNLIAV